MDFRTFQIPLRTPFRGLTVRQGMLARGTVGWTEFSPFPEYDHQACVPWLQAALEAASSEWPEPIRETVPVNGIVPAFGRGSHAVAMAAQSECDTVKVKVAQTGETLANDIERVSAIRAEFPDMKIRIDANGAWSVREALKAIRLLDEAAEGLEYVEQPCEAVEELAEVRSKVDVLIAADESIRRASDPFRVRDLGAADIAVLKVQPLGGVRACLRIAEQIDMPVVVSSAVETSIGLTASIALAAALPELPYACGIGTGHLLAADVVASPVRPKNGELHVGRVDLDEDLFRAVQADPDIDDLWQARLSHVQDLL